MCKRVLLIFGTRPEAVKLCPVVVAMRQDTPELDVQVCVTAQHREMLDAVLDVFGISPDFDLGVMRPGQTLIEVTSRILAGLEPVIAAARPDMVLVQGDTTTTVCGALAAFYAQVPVGHVEAGLRTGDSREPFPEEMNRLLVTRLSSLHFAATAGAARNLISEGVEPAAVHVTGNTGIDALLYIARSLDSGTLRAPLEWTDHLDPARKTVVVTAHRRENFGNGFNRICSALVEIARRSDVQIVYPVHPNPNVSGPVRERLGDHPNILLTDPLDYVSFVNLMRHSHLLLTDSGGIQEEAPSLGKPVLVMRDKTERPEAIEAGTAELVGTGVERIVNAVAELLDNEPEYARRSRFHNPYGNGQGSRHIAGIVRDRLT